MKFPAISERERRNITLLVSVLVLGLGYAKGWKPYKAALDDARDNLDQQTTALSKERAAVATSKNNPALLKVADSAMDAVTPRLFLGRDSVAAASALASYLDETAAANHVLLTHYQTRGATVAPSGIRTLRVDINAQSDVQGIVAYLGALDHGERLVCVEKMTMGTLASVDTTKGIQVITMAATIDGYQLGDPPQIKGRVGAPGPAAPTTVMPSATPAPSSGLLLPGGKPVAIAPCDPIAPPSPMPVPGAPPVAGRAGAAGQ